MVKKMLLSRNALLAVTVILVVSLCAGITGLVLPTTQYTSEMLASYTHHGTFFHTEYKVSQAADAPSVLFPKIIDELEILFSYTGPTAEPAAIRVSLLDQNGSWEKEVRVQTSDKSPVVLPLNLVELLTTGNAINEELGVRGNGYLVRIAASVDTDSTPFTLTLEGNLDANLLTWNEAGFNKVEWGFPGDDKLRAAAFGYRAVLKENSLFGAMTLERKADIPLLEALGERDVPAVETVRASDIFFQYRFTSSAPVSSISQEIRVTMTVAEAGGWSKTYDLIPLTAMDEVRLDIPLDINRLMALVEGTGQPPGSRVATDKQVTIAAQVHTIARTDAGVIDELFNQQLNGTIGRQITWKDTNDTGSNQLDLRNHGTITRTVALPNTAVVVLRVLSLVVMVLSSGLFAYLFIVNRRGKPAPSVDEILKKHQKKYGELISEVVSFEPVREYGTYTQVNSLEALVKIANNSLKPVLLQVMPDKLIYRVVDGATTYEYTDLLLK